MPFLTFVISLKHQHALLDFCYLAQAPAFTSDSLERLTSALQEFHQHKDAVIQCGPRDGWGIPKLELLQSVVPGIRQSGMAMQWTANITKHAHVEEIKVPARTGNNQNYYSQIARHLNRLDKCFHFDLVTYIEEHHLRDQEVDDSVDDGDNNEDHEPDSETLASAAGFSTPGRLIIDYFSISSTLVQQSNPPVAKPLRTFATTTTAFHVVTKPSLRLTIAEASTQYDLPDLVSAITTFLAQRGGDSRQRDTIKLQVWRKVRIQQKSYHNTENIEPPQTVRAIPASATNPFGQFDSVIFSSGPDSEWPKGGLAGHFVAQLQMIFRLSDIFVAYIQCFVQVGDASPVTGMHHLKRAVRSNDQHIGEVIPLTLICSPTHLIPRFGAKVHPRLTKLNSYQLSSEFWLNKYWSKEFYYALSP